MDEEFYSASLRADLERMEERFDCTNIYEIDFIAKLYLNPEGVKKFIHKYCKHWLESKPSYMEVHETLKRQGFEKDYINFSA